MYSKAVFVTIIVSVLLISIAIHPASALSIHIVYSSGEGYSYTIFGTKWYETIEDAVLVNGKIYAIGGVDPGPLGRGDILFVTLSRDLDILGATVYGTQGAFEWGLDIDYAKGYLYVRSFGPGAWAPRYAVFLKLRPDGVPIASAHVETAWFFQDLLVVGNRVYSVADLWASPLVHLLIDNGTKFVPVKYLELPTLQINNRDFYFILDSYGNNIYLVSTYAVHKLDLDLNVSWIRSVPREIQLNSIDANYLGVFVIGESGDNGVLMRISHDGSLEWAIAFSVEKCKVVPYRVLAIGEKIIVAGRLEGECAQGKRDSFIAFFTADGKLLGIYAIKGEGIDNVNAVLLHPKGLALFGSTTSSKLEVVEIKANARKMLLSLKPVEYKPRYREFSLKSYDIVALDISKEVKKGLAGDRDCFALIITRDLIPYIPPYVTIPTPTPPQTTPSPSPSPSPSPKPTPPATKPAPTKTITITQFRTVTVSIPVTKTLYKTLIPTAIAYKTEYRTKILTERITETQFVTVYTPSPASTGYEEMLALVVMFIGIALAAIGIICLVAARRRFGYA